MRTLAAGLVMATSVAIADDLGEAHRHALAARDSYWTCLAEKHVSVNSRNRTAQDFALYVSGVCPCERQSYVDALSGDEVPEHGCRNASGNR
jgi:hypothetical protein